MRSIWGTYPIDPSTGLPAVPENHFWRVTRLLGLGYVQVELRARRRIGSKLVKHSVIHKEDVTPDKILDRAMYVLWSVAKSQNQPAGYKHLLGDYPPKKLTALKETP